MAPLIRKMSWHDAQWIKFKRSYMWNKIYFLRRTKFVVYQLAGLAVNIVQGLGGSELKQYCGLQNKDIPDFPNARIDASDIIGIFAFNTLSCVFLGFLFGVAVLFDLFWPEREEARCIQWTWKLSAAAASVFQFAAALASTIVVATRGVHIHEVSVKEETIIRGNWNGPHLVYHQEKVALAAVVADWIASLFTFWSTIVMWRCYSHNNRYGPFADHERECHDGESIPTENVLCHG